MLWKPLTLCTALVLSLAGCGSGDDFPGGTKNQDPDPLITDVPMFYIERPLRMDEEEPDTIEQDTLRDPLAFHGSAHLYMKVRAAQSVESIDLSARAVEGNVDVRDLDVSPDGRYVLFSLRGPGDPEDDEEDLPSWNIWVYDIQMNSLRRVINDVNQDDKGHDIMARFLPGDSHRIIFASTRQQKSRSILQDEGKDQFSHLEESRQQPALNLHVMNFDGSGITQVTFNQSHDMYPIVVSNGKVVYSRWDRYANDNGIHLYEMNPDGTETQLLYGRHSHTAGNEASALEFIRGNLMPDGDLFVLARPNNTDFYGGDFIRINTDQYVDNTQPVSGFNGTGPAQTTVTNKQIFTDGTTISPGGYFSAFFPMWDNTNRALVSWSQCRVVIGNETLPCTATNLEADDAEPAPIAYGLWIYNYQDNTQIPVVVAREGVVYTDVALGAAHTQPTIISDGSSLTGPTDGRVSAETFSNMMAAENEEAILHIRSVYDFNGAYNDLDTAVNRPYSTIANPTLSDASDRPARFLRIIKAVSEPDRELKEPANGSFGNAGAQRMKEIIGYAPIEPDGSVKVRVPANVALSLNVVDANGKSLAQANRHNNWITLRPGEVMECKGCHAAGNTGAALPPHGRYDAQAPSINSGRPQGSAYPGAVSTITSPFAGATMAEARVAAAEDADDEIMELSADILYTDVWTDTGSEAADAPVSLRYQDLPNYSMLVSSQTTPTNGNCTPWNSHCRIVINYNEHIQSLWELDRGALTTPILATNPIHDNDNDPMTAPPAATCIGCHSAAAIAATGDADGIPTTQLELTNQADVGGDVRVRSWFELFTTRPFQVAVNNNTALADCTSVLVPVLDGNGDPVLDENGDPVTENVCPPGVTTTAATMNSGGARASAAFFNKFEGAGSHAGYLTPAELRLIAEWLDIGGQYYNNHFKAPDAD
ncbi:MAG TPA: hypothetical protein VM553_12775 [Dongiaceae bacterium]|nr:hypothetical protein [Dongiaceae bacterium]